MSKIYDSVILSGAANGCIVEGSVSKGNGFLANARNDKRDDNKICKYKEVSIMKKMKWIALLLALSLLVLPGCAEKDAQDETTNQSAQGNQEKDWEEILTYAEYLEMSKEEQDDFYASFEDPAEFFQWFDAVKAIYDEYREENQYDGGAIDIGGMSGD